MLSSSVRGQVVLADVGGAPGGSSPYDRAKFEAIVRGEVLMGIVAHNIGQAEARLGSHYLRSVAQDLQLPLVSCNVRDTQGTLIGQPYRLECRDGYRILLVGVLSDREPMANLRIDPPITSILSTVRQLTGAYDGLVVLAYLAEEELQQLALQLPEADVVVGGPTIQSISPRRQGPTLVAAATNKGKFLVQLRAPDSSSPAVWQGEVVELTETWGDEPRQQGNLRRLLSVAGQARSDARPDCIRLVAGRTRRIPIGGQR